MLPPHGVWVTEAMLMGDQCASMVRVYISLQHTPVRGATLWLARKMNFVIIVL